MSEPTTEFFLKKILICSQIFSKENIPIDANAAAKKKGKIISAPESQQNRRKELLIVMNCYYPF